MEAYLRCFVNGQPLHWSRWLHWAEYCYNTSPQTSIKMSPFQALYGRLPPTLFRFVHNTTTVDSMEQWLRERDAILDDLKFQLLKNQHRMKLTTDLKRRDVSFTVGEVVYLKLQPYHQQCLARCRRDKLSAHFYGPYEILAKVVRWPINWTYLLLAKPIPSFMFLN